MLHNRELVTVESIDFRVLGTLLCSALLNRLFQPVVTSEAFTTYIGKFRQQPSSMYAAAKLSDASFVPRRAKSKGQIKVYRRE
jgi:hypothetical protein